MKKKSRIPAAKMALYVNKLTTAIVPTGADPGDPLDPFVQKRTTRNDRIEIAVGTRTFFAGSLEIDGGDPVQLIAERQSRDEKQHSGEQETFHPVKADLTLDTTVELYKQPRGRWGVRGGQPIPVSAAWLAGNGFDTLHTAAFRPGFHQIGSRECCVGEIMLRGKANERSAPVLVERVPSQDGTDGGYRLVNADLGRGDAVMLVNGPARSDPFVTEVLRRIGETWGADPRRPAAETAAVNALRAGASVEAALAVADALRPPAGAAPDAAAIQTQAAAGAAAGAAQRAGLPAQAAVDCARTLADAAAFLDGRPAAIAATYGGANAVALPDLRAVELLTGTNVPTEAELRSAAIVAAHATAGAGLAAAQAAVAMQDRTALGPELSAINAAARELLIEKKMPAGGLAAVAARAAEKRVAIVQKNVEEVSAEAARTTDELGRVEVRIAALRADLTGKPPAAAETAAIRKALGYEQNKRDRLAATLRDTAENSPEAARIGDELSKAEVRIAAIEADLTGKPPAAAESAAIEKSLEYEEKKRDELVARLLRQQELVDAADGELASVSGDLQPLCTAVAKALEAANAAAPGQQHAAVAAAKAAAVAMRGVDDAVRAERAAGAAHLAALAGANEDEAEVAGRLMAGHHDAAGGTLSDLEEKAAQAAIVQIVTGGIPANDDDRRRQLLAAAAAAAALDGTKPGLAAAAAIGPAVAGAAALSLADRNRLPSIFSIATPGEKAPDAARPVLPAIPEHYEPVETRFDPAKAVAVDEWKHAKIRQVTDLGLVGSTGPSTTTYIIEVMGPRGRAWVDFDWSPNANQLYGDIPIKPSGVGDDRPGAQAKTVIAYSGITSDWGSFEQRTRDLTARTDAAFAEVARLLTSRDHDGSMTQLHYHGEKSRHLANLLPHLKTRMEEEIRLFVQGRHSQPAFKENLAKMFVDLIEKIEGDRSRKKAIVRHQVDTMIRIVLAVVIGGGVGSARVAAGFMGGG